MKIMERLLSFWGDGVDVMSEVPNLALQQLTGTRGKGVGKPPPFMREQALQRLEQWSGRHACWTRPLCGCSFGSGSRLGSRQP